MEGEKGHVFCMTLILLMINLTIKIIPAMAHDMHVQYNIICMPSFIPCSTVCMITCIYNILCNVYYGVYLFQLVRYNYYMNFVVHIALYDSNSTLKLYWYACRKVSLLNFNMHS